MSASTSTAIIPHDGRPTATHDTKNYQQHQQHGGINFHCHHRSKTTTAIPKNDDDDDEIPIVKWKELELGKLLGQGSYSSAYEILGAHDDNDSDKRILKQLSPKVKANPLMLVACASDLVQEGQILHLKSKVEQHSILIIGLLSCTSSVALEVLATDECFHKKIQVGN